MSERKYRQSGYMENDRDRDRDRGQGREQQPKKPQQPRDREGPRSPKMMAFSQKVKCAACSATVQTNVSPDATCPKCRAELHSCRQCTFFDPGARFECRKPITAKIMNKSARNTCDLFATRTVVERDTSSGKPTDARQAFANLFKK